MNARNPLFLMGMISVALIALAIFIAIWVWILLLLYKALKAVPPEHRKIEPWTVWLLFIPFFNLIWNFFVFLWIPDSYANYFKSIGRNNDVGTVRGIGLAYAICSACSIIPYVSALVGIPCLVLLIIFLVKINGLRKQITAIQQGGFPVIMLQNVPQNS